MLKGIILNDRIKVPTQRKYTDSGQLIVPCAFARSGSQVYSAGTLGIPSVKPETPITVMRDEADVFDEDSMASFRSVPVTIGHPKENGKAISVTADNADKLQVGVLEGVPVRDDTKLTGNLVIARRDAIELIEDGTQELSAGYTCDIETVDAEDGSVLYFQRNIRANHIAIVDKGRAGSHIRIADEDEIVTDELVVDEVVTASGAIDEEVVDKAVCQDITPEPVVADEVDEVVPTVDVVVDEKPEPLKLGDEGYEIYTALRMLNDEVKAINDYTDAIAYCEDESLKGVFSYIVKDEQDHAVKILAWLASQNVAEVMEDEFEGILAKAKVLADSFETTKPVVIADELEEANAVIAKLNDELDAGVEARVEVIMVAKEFTDLQEFSGKSIVDIRKEVVAHVMPKLNLDGKDDAYINARFDIIVEDSISGETSMSQVLRKSSVTVVDTKPVDPVAEARKNMIARQSKK